MKGTDEQGGADYTEHELVEGVDVLDPETNEILQLEEDRQARKLILIPSESLTPRAVRQAIGSAFVSLYAEGYPPERMTGESEDGLKDHERHLAFYRRYADRRFYKGTEYVHFVEALAQRRCADCFANEEVRREDIHVNVQPISGALANLAVYKAFLEPGDTVLAMELSHGGHLSHGSEFHVSGRTYRMIPYGVTPTTGRLDYDQIEDLAVKHRPSLIIAGYTSYPWAPDWKRFRQIADRCGARLMADVAHPAGLIAGGVYPSPVGSANVVCFTTHKTLCGPRGACILTFNDADAARVDAAVFPGLQGGPHVANIAAMAVCFQLARTGAFAGLQRRIVDNARALAEALRREGVPLAYGGTDTHLLLADLNKLNPGGEAPLWGEPASRILDLAGLVVNKNTLPGDPSTALASGIRVGTPWVTQLGFGQADMERIAEWLARVLKAIVPFRYIGRSGLLPRGKVPFDVLHRTRQEIKAFLDSSSPRGKEGVGHREGRGIVRGRWDRTGEPLDMQGNKGAGKRGKGNNKNAPLNVEFHALFHYRFIRVQGRRASPLVQQVSTGDAAGLAPGQVQQSFVLDEQGRLLDDVLILREEAVDPGEGCFLIVTHREVSERLLSWLVALSDGYVVFDPEEPYRKVEGPVTLHATPAPMGQRGALLAFTGSVEEFSRLPGGIGKEAVNIPDNGWRRVEDRDGEVLICRVGKDRLYWIGTEERGKERVRELQEAGLASFGREHWEELRKEEGLPDHRQLSLPESEERETRRPHGSDLIRAGHGDRFVWDVPYFVGQGALTEHRPKGFLPDFKWSGGDTGLPEEKETFKRTPIHTYHEVRQARFIRFAGWKMPGWYKSATEEHHAVRKASGLFDTTHMGVLEIRGPQTEEFLDLVCSNYARWYPNGMSYYGYLLDVHGGVLDDVIVYRRAQDRFMVVVNAGNHAKILAWLEAVNRAEVAIDRDRRDLKRLRPVDIRNLSDPDACGEDARVDLALQGPQSRKVLLDLLEDKHACYELKRLKKGALLETTVLGLPVLVARTGYTGEIQGYELFVHPEGALDVWKRILEIGEPAGLKAAGLVARDSLRIEAGLPLYGHELAGPEGIHPGTAGFGAYVKFHKPFFVGRVPSLAAERERTMEVCRFRMMEQGIRVPRQGDPVANRKGRVLGKVTSCAMGTDGYLVGLACLEKGQALPGTELEIFSLPSRPVKEKSDKAALEVGDRVVLTQTALILERFPSAEEREGWR